MASNHGHSEIVHILLHNGANIHMKDLNGKTAIELAKTHSHSTNVLKVFQSFADYNHFKLHIEKSNNIHLAKPLIKI